MDGDKATVTRPQKLYTKRVITIVIHLLLRFLDAMYTCLPRLSFCARRLPTCRPTLFCLS